MYMRVVVFGPNPRIGIPVARDVQPEDVFISCESYAHGICKPW